jgi:hypothetical protein
MFLKNHPDYSALPGARQNTRYAELGIRDISIRKIVAADVRSL